VFNVPAYYNGVVYVSVVNGPLMAFQISNGLFATTSGQVAIASSRSTENYGYAPPSPRISASPSGGAVAWAIESYANGTVDGSGPLGPAILRAYDATNLGSTLWASNNSSADTASNASKFISPVVANGHVYLAGNGGFTVYGLAP
jgi:hypothetical protein